MPWRTIKKFHDFQRDDTDSRERTLSSSHTTIVRSFVPSTLNEARVLRVNEIHRRRVEPYRSESTSSCAWEAIRYAWKIAWKIKNCDPTRACPSLFLSLSLSRVNQICFSSKFNFSPFGLNRDKKQYEINCYLRKCWFLCKMYQETTFIKQNQVNKIKSDLSEYLVFIL